MYTTINSGLPSTGGGGNINDNLRTDIVTTMCYLTGVAQNNLDANFSPVKIDELKNNEKATIIRHLCILRQQFLINFTKISNSLFANPSMETLGDLLSAESINYLRDKGIEVIYVTKKGTNNYTVYIAYLNQYILDNIPDVKNLFPDWIVFDYIKALFLMPGCYAGNKGSQIDSSSKQNKVFAHIHGEKKKYLTDRNRNLYPFGVYLNWPKNLREDMGNIFYNDNKFLKLLYSANGDIFKATEYLTDAKQETKDSIYDFVDRAKKVAIFVDCENITPFAFLACLKNLNEENMRKICKIVLYDDVNTSPAWLYMKDETPLPIERIEVERILSEKSFLDTRIASDVVKLYHRENIESVILASSDSDFWGLISSLTDANYYVLNERRRTSPAILEKLDEKNIRHCFIDDFAQDKVQQFKTRVLVTILNDKINEFNDTGTMETLDAGELIDNLFHEAYITGADTQMEQEKMQFFNTYLKSGLLLRPQEEDGKTVFKMELNRKW